MHSIYSSMARWPLKLGCRRLSVFEIRYVLSKKLAPNFRNIVNPFRCELGAAFGEGSEGCNDPCAVASTAAASCYAVSIRGVSDYGERTGKPLTAGFFMDCIKERNILLFFMNIAASPLRSKGIFVNKNFKLLRESNLSGFFMLQKQCLF